MTKEELLVRFDSYYEADAGPEFRLWWDGLTPEERH